MGLGVQLETHSDESRRQVPKSEPSPKSFVFFFSSPFASCPVNTPAPARFLRGLASDSPQIDIVTCHSDSHCLFKSRPARTVGACEAHTVCMFGFPCRTRARTQQNTPGHPSLSLFLSGSRCSSLVIILW